MRQQWASTNPPPKSSGALNPGWPGCCRRPTPEDHRFIAPADWRAVSIIHRIPIPPDIKAILYNATGFPMPPMRASSSGSSSGGTVRSTTSSTSYVNANMGVNGAVSPVGMASAGTGAGAVPPPIVRRTSSMMSSPTRTSLENVFGKTAPPNGQVSKGKTGSPQQSTTGLVNGRTDELASPTSSHIELYESNRRSSADNQSERKINGSPTSQHSPGRKIVDMDSNSVSRRSSTDRRPSISLASPSSSVSRATGDALNPQSPSSRRRAGIAVQTSQSTSASNSAPPPLSGTTQGIHAASVASAAAANSVLGPAVAMLPGQSDATTSVPQVSSSSSILSSSSKVKRSPERQTGGTISRKSTLSFDKNSNNGLTDGSLPPLDVSMSSLSLSNTDPNSNPPVSNSTTTTPLSSASSDSSGGSNSETTVISDGGFTDYLSDESEQELQRQAEARAEVLAQNHFEEQEFKKARLQLAHVDLRPPKSWTSSGSAGSAVSVGSAGSGGGGSAGGGSPRSQSGGNTTPPGSTISHARG